MKKYFTIELFIIFCISLYTMYLTVTKGFSEAFAVAFIPLLLVWCYTKLSTILENKSREVIFFDEITSDSDIYKLQSIYRTVNKTAFKQHDKSIVIIKKVKGIDYAGVYLLKNN